MYISSCFHLLLAFSTLSSAFPPPTRMRGDGTPVVDPNPNALAYLEGLTHNTRDKSRAQRDPPEKYFHEAMFNTHYDGRFANSGLHSSERLAHMRALMKTYLSTMHIIGAETWIMHGSLLGWWWNHKIMPWDTDIDVQVSESAIKLLASYHNMTVHTFQDAGSLVEGLDLVGEKGAKVTKKYLLEVNPNYINPSTSDNHNVIDARWIDIDTGLFIDITTVRVDRESVDLTLPWDKANEKPVKLYCKDRHRFLSSQIYPLRSSIFEGIPVKIPYAYQALLAEEYGNKALVNTNFLREKHFFDQSKKEWVMMSQEQMDAERAKLKEADQKKFDLYADYKWGERGRLAALKQGIELIIEPEVQVDVDGSEMGKPQPGKMGEVHHPPGSVEDY